MLAVSRISWVGGRIVEIALLDEVLLEMREGRHLPGALTSLYLSGFLTPETHRPKWLPHRVPKHSARAHVP